MRNFPFIYKIQVFSAIFFCSLLFFLLIVFSTFISIKLFQTHQATVILINFYGEKIIAEFNNESIPLNIMEIKVVRNHNLSKNINIKNINGKKITEIEPSVLNDSPNLVIEPIHKTKTFCFFKADVTDFYYQAEEQNLRDIKILRKEREHDNLIFIERSKILVYPGKASQKYLPKNLKPDQSIYGIYPILCKYTANLQKLKETVIDFKNYNEEANREYFRSRLKKINSLYFFDT